MNALLDPALEYIIFASTQNGTETDLECDATAAGVVPSELHFPMSQESLGAACKQKRGTPPPPLNDEFKYSVVEHPTANLTAWGQVPGVETLTVVLDGRMNGCDLVKEFPGLPMDCSEAPDLRNATQEQLEDLALGIAEAYCAYPVVSGIQIDLEPYAAPWHKSLNSLLGAVSKALRATEHGCVSERYPQGRAISLFAYPDALQGTGLASALGPNGYIVVSGYDLYTPDMGDKAMFNTPKEYAAKLQKEVNAIQEVCSALRVPFSLAIPISASTHEYEKYTPGKYCGDICTSHQNPARMTDYFNAAINVVEANPLTFPQGNVTSLFRGLSLWLWTGPGGDAVEYPNHSGNLWTPGNPGDDMLTAMRQRLPITKATHVSLLSGSTAFEIVWNAPSQSCSHQRGSNITIGQYGVTVNPHQAFIGSEIALLYTIGDWPRLSATKNATACWESPPPCSWNPWDKIDPVSNGGVPQVANLTSHVAAVVADLTAAVPDPAFSGLLIIDWEAWRPLASELDDDLSMYIEYSARLVKSDPNWPNSSSAAQLAAEAGRRFNSGARDIFSATVATIRKLRPAARIGFYSQGINQPNTTAGKQASADLLWLWQVVDVLCPSIYPRSANATEESLRVAPIIAGAIFAADLVDPAIRPAVMPYARALLCPSCGPTEDQQVFHRGMLATQVQIAAGMGAEGVILWGASSDYHGDGCAAIEGAVLALGPTMRECIHNRAACSKEHCRGTGRCADYSPANLLGTCLGNANAAPAACRG